MTSRDLLSFRRAEMFWHMKEKFKSYLTWELVMQERRACTTLFCEIFSNLIRIYGT